MDWRTHGATHPWVDAALSVRVVVLSPRGHRLAVRLCREADDHTPVHWALPADGPRGESVERCARRLVQRTTGASACWIDQMAIEEPRPDARELSISIDYVALVAAAVSDDSACESSDNVWFAQAELPPLVATDHAAVSRAVASLRSRTEREPIAFRLVPARFTLRELQEIYELLAGQALHKASFRRALFAAHLVEATDEWRREGRGRPARLYRYAPGTPRSSTRGVRFDRLET